MIQGVLSGVKSQLEDDIGYIALEMMKRFLATTDVIERPEVGCWQQS